MDRPTWEELFINIAREVSQRSTCLRLRVGAVLVQDNRIISIGYNGSIPGHEHCDDYWKKYYISMSDLDGEFEDWIHTQDFYDKHYEWSAVHEVHAEMNAILFAARRGIEVEGSTLYLTHSPCIHCAKAIAQAGIRAVVYDQLYYRSAEGLKVLENKGIECTESH